MPLTALKGSRTDPCRRLIVGTAISASPDPSASWGQVEQPGELSGGRDQPGAHLAVITAAGDVALAGHAPDARKLIRTLQGIA
jgi:hypothetical protein